MGVGWLPRTTMTDITGRVHHDTRATRTHTTTTTEHRLELNSHWTEFDNWKTSGANDRGRFARLGLAPSTARRPGQSQPASWPFVSLGIFWFLTLKIVKVNFDFFQGVDKRDNGGFKDHFHTTSADRPTRTERVSHFNGNIPVR